jgi:hypothetical protein
MRKVLFATAAVGLALLGGPVSAMAQPTVEQKLEQLRQELKNYENQAQDCEIKLVPRGPQPLNDPGSPKFIPQPGPPLGGQALQEWKKKQQEDVENSPAARAQREAWEKEKRCRPYFEEKARREQAKLELRMQEQIRETKEHCENVKPERIKQLLEEDTFAAYNHTRVLDMHIYMTSSACVADVVTNHGAYTLVFDFPVMNGKSYVHFESPKL